MMTMSKPKIGGGCRPVGINPELKIRHDALEAKRREAEHQKWLLSEEGKAHTRLMEADRLARLEQAQRIQEEQRKEAVHAQRFAELVNKVPVGLTIEQTDYIVYVQRNDKTDAQSRFVAYALLEVVGDYPAEPAYHLATQGRRGLKVFLNARSRDWLEKCKDAQDQIGYTMRTGKAQLAFWGSIKLPHLKIIGTSQSGKSAQGEFIL